MHTPTHLRGMTIIELLLYVAILVLLVGVTVGALLSLSGIYRNLRSLEAVNENAQSSLERIVREVRGATSVDTLQSTFGTNPSDLYLNSLDVNGASTTVEFFATSSAVHIKEAGVDSGPLTSSNVKVTKLIFRLLTSAKSQAVKVEMTIESGTSTNYVTKNFYSTAVLRGSYPVQ
jgi:type II secretory pathway pseudopilin PulG